MSVTAQNLGMLREIQGYPKSLIDLSHDSIRNVSNVPLEPRNSYCTHLFAHYDRVDRQSRGSPSYPDLARIDPLKISLIAHRYYHHNAAVVVDSISADYDNWPVSSLF